MNANDTLRHHFCTEGYYRYLCGMVLTDGAKALADNFKCYWLLDVVCSYQSKMQKACDGFQVWKLKKNTDGTFTVTGEDGNKNTLVTQHFEYSDFSADEATLWVEDNVILLPSEH